MNRRFGWAKKRPARFHSRSLTTTGGFIPTVSDQDWHAIAHALASLEGDVQAFRQRFEQLQTLHTERQQVMSQIEHRYLGAETLSQLRQQLASLEERLDSLMFDWRSLLEPFWQAVRFGGLGVIVGWLLHRLTQ
jgi:hypothetical protein